MIVALLEGVSETVGGGKLKKWSAGWAWWCPGCNFAHVYDQRWQGPGDVDSPTFTPSLLIQTSINAKPHVCHCYVTNGQIQFLPDSSHGLAGKTVPLPVWPFDD